MKPVTEINFTTAESKSKYSAGKICYQGVLAHNRTLGSTETLEAFAEYANMKLPTAKFAIDSLAAFIAQEVACGNRLDFGPFSISLKMRGGFPAANSPFDAKENAIAVEMTPGKDIRKSVRYLKPVNANAYHSAQIFNTVLLPEGRIVDTMPAEGTSKLSSVGHYLHVHVGATGEGVWIENDEGERLIEGVVLECDSALCQFEVTTHLKPGLYWLVICSRDDLSGEFVEARRRITAK